MQYNPGKCLLRYSWRKKRLSRLWKQDDQKVEKWPFLKRGLTDDFDPKMTIFPTFFFLGNIGKENVFYDILERKNAFLGYINKKFKKSKNWHFPKGLTHGFDRKMTIFPTFFFRQYRQGKFLLRYSFFLSG